MLAPLGKTPFIPLCSETHNTESRTTPLLLLSDIAKANQYIFANFFSPSGQVGVSTDFALGKILL
jgi:hypothetical protein